jgi:uncharacterized protein (TIGR00251 family)
VTHTPELPNAITIHARGSVLSITVAPRSSVNRLDQLSDGSLHVRITAPPVDSAANTALLRFLADILDVPRSRLTIASGASSRHKRVVVEGLGPDDLAEKLANIS